jgi:xanthine dehydrogenase small subunit
MADALRFWWRGALVEIAEEPAGTTVLEWLRRDPSATGTKEGCCEGDCGACTVVVGTPVADGAEPRLDLHPANACLLLLPTLHGRALFTVEDVARDGVLHPLQRELVAQRGTQCGFCTPGVVMALWSELETVRDGTPPDRAALADALAGNLCRCTGYGSILDAAQTAAAERPRAEHPRRDVLAALAAVPPEEPLVYVGGGSTFLAPTTTAGLVDALASHPEAEVVAGGTDLVLAARQAGRDLPPLVWTGRVRDLARVERTPTHLSIGSAATLEQAWAALAAEVPSLRTWWKRFAGPAIRSTGTMGGNVANGSPIADATPVLLALDAEVVLADSEGERRFPLEDFHTGRRETALRPGEVLLRIEVPLTALARDVRAWKSARRYDSDITTASGVFALVLDEGDVKEARVVLGGMAATVRRAHAVEAALSGRRWDRSTLDLALAALADDVTPISDHRGSAAHRIALARGLLERWWWQTRPDDPLPADLTDIWATP